MPSPTTAKPLPQAGPSLRQRWGNLGILSSASVVRAFVPGCVLLLPNTEPLLKAFWILFVAAMSHVPGFLSESLGVTKSYQYWWRSMPCFLITGAVFAISTMLLTSALEITSAIEVVAAQVVIPAVVLGLMWLQVPRNTNLTARSPLASSDKWTKVKFVVLALAVTATPLISLLRPTSLKGDLLALAAAVGYGLFGELYRGVIIQTGMRGFRTGLPVFVFAAAIAAGVAIFTNASSDAFHYSDESEMGLFGWAGDALRTMPTLVCGVGLGVLGVSTYIYTLEMMPLSKPLDAVVPSTATSTLTLLEAGGAIGFLYAIGEAGLASNAVFPWIALAAAVVGSQTLLHLSRMYWDVLATVDLNRLRHPSSASKGPSTHNAPLSDRKRYRQDFDPSALHLDESIITLHPDWLLARTMFRMFGAVLAIQNCDSRVKIVKSDGNGAATGPLEPQMSNLATQMQMTHAAVTPPRVVTIGNMKQQGSSRRSRLVPVDLQDESQPAAPSPETTIRPFDSQKALDSRMLKASGRSNSAKIPNQQPARFKRTSVAVAPVFHVEESDGGMTTDSAPSGHPSPDPVAVELLPYTPVGGPDPVSFAGDEDCMPEIYHGASRRRASSLENPRIVAALGIKVQPRAGQGDDSGKLRRSSFGGDTPAFAAEDVNPTNQTNSQEMLRHNESDAAIGPDGTRVRRARNSIGGPIILAPLRTRPVQRLPGAIATPTSPKGGNALLSSPLSVPRPQDRRSSDGDAMPQVQAGQAVYGRRPRRASEVLQNDDSFHA